jgi:hypothetical protein
MVAAVAAVIYAAGSETAAAILAGVLVVLLPVNLRMRLSADAGGVTVVNFVSHRIPWSDVAGFEIGSPRHTIRTLLGVRCVSGRTVWSWAVGTRGVRGVAGYNWSQLDTFVTELEHLRMLGSRSAGLSYV